MYTYESFVTNGAFTLLRPIYITLLLISISLLLLIIIPRAKQKWLNGLTVVCLSLIPAFLAAQVIFYDAIIVDELGLGGDGTNTIMCLVIVALGLINPFLYFVPKGKAKVNG